MEHRLVFSQDLENKFISSSADSKNAWNSIGAADYMDLMEVAVDKLNTAFEKLNITEFMFNKTVEMYGQSNTYFGLIKNEDNTVLAYVFVIPPKYETRSGVLAQQVFPVMSGITPKLNHSKDIRITNRAVYIINLNECRLTAATAVNIVSGQILGFRYVDVYDRNIDAVLVSHGMKPKIKTVADYDDMVAKVNKSGCNEFFSLDQAKKVITFLTTRLKDGIHVNNEPYWFALKAYAAAYLAKAEGYRFDLSQINTLKRGNKTLNAFRDFAEKADK